MKTLLAVAAAFAAATIATAAAANGPPASATATATGTVVKPIAITNTAGLAFGRFVSPTSAATLTINPMGAFESGSDPSGIKLSGGFQSAKFTVTGEPSTAFAISFPPSSPTLSSGTNTMTISQFSTSNTQLAIRTDGVQSFTVGATLTIGANQPVGTYTGTFPVTVAYQ